MFCFLVVALFNTLNSGTLIHEGPVPYFWIVLIVNPHFIYGLVEQKLKLYLIALVNKWLNLIG